MDFAMEDGYCEIENSGCSSTSTIDNWNDWSPVIDDWAPLAGDTTDIDFHSLIESMMMPDSACNFPESTTTSNESSPARIPEHDDSSVGEGVGDDDKGLRLVHMLMAAAEALTGAHKSRELARVILVRLREMVSSPAVIAGAGSNMERLAAHFTDALQGLVDGTRAGGSHHRPPEDRHQSGDVTAAFQLLQDMSPYVKFGHFTANQAIIESVSSDRRVHIVDFDIMEGVQWASLMQALISQKDGPPPPHVRITAITRGGVGVGGGGSGRKPMSSIQETGRRLVSFAASLGLPFSFSQCRLDPDEKFRPSAIKVVKGETLIANCVLHPPHLPHRPASSIASFLTGIATLNAKLVTLVEEEGEIRRKGDEENGFVGQFMDELQRYSAIWDSLEAGFPKQGWARGLVEKVILGPTIASTVQRAYRRLEEKEGERGWGDWMSNTMGFGRVGITFFNHCQARLLLGLFNDGYRVEEDAANKLVLGWKSRRLISASVWSAPPPYLPPSTTTSGFSG